MVNMHFTSELKVSRAINLSWYVLYTRAKWEKKVVKKLAQRNIEFYCPMHSVKRQWSDRKKVISEPLFKSYVFVRLDDPKSFPFKQVDGSLNFLYWLSKPARVKDEEIETIKSFLKDYEHIKIEKSSVCVDDKVKILTGPLIEREGKVLEVKHRTVRVFLPSLGYNIVAEIEKSKIEIVMVNQKASFEKSVGE